MTKEAELGIGKDRRKVDINEEYYRLAAKVSFRYFPSGEVGKLKPFAGSGRLGEQKSQKVARRKRWGMMYHAD